MADVANSKLLKGSTGIPAKNAFIVLVKTEWNAAIADELEKGCLEGLGNNGVKKVVTITVPGAVEIPFAIKKYWDTRGKRNLPADRQGQPDAFIALGCVIRGGTPHFDYVCQSVTEGVTLLNHSLPVPTIFGVLTVDNEEQAWERLGGAHGHKGKEAAITALKMIAMIKSFE